MIPPFKQIQDDLQVSVNVKTGQPNNQIYLEGEKIIIRIKSPPVKGKANKSIVKMAKKIFKRDVIIISGFKSTKKTLLLKNIDINEALELLRKNNTPERKNKKKG
ncbi:MAG: DUF167 domain-containing protein [Candidatus Hodarchaeales archaeon]